MHLLLPSPQVAMGVFQNLMVLKYEAGALAWYWAQEPAWRASICVQALLLTGVSPKEMACWAWTFGVLTHRDHMYAQLGCGALAASIQVSAQPVAPSEGMVSATGALAAFRVLVWYGHAAPTTTSPFWNREISSEASPQYFLISGRCPLSRSTAALNCACVSS